eukprot:jgi/Botrbrau1/21938/Bobra.0249s0061.1
MTWRTPRGNRVLNPAEAKLFARAVCCILDRYDDEPSEGLNYGFPITEGPFERLTTPQKLTVLEEVAEALLTETPVPQLFSLNENAIYYVFRWINQEFDVVEDGEESWGQLVLDALGSWGRDDAGEGSGEAGRDPFIGCGDPTRWDRALDQIADRILWDRDFEMAEEASSFPPELLAEAQIRADYFAVRQVCARSGAADRLQGLCSRFYE